MECSFGGIYPAWCPLSCLDLSGVTLTWEYSVITISSLPSVPFSPGAPVTHVTASQLCPLALGQSVLLVCSSLLLTFGGVY